MSLLVLKPRPLARDSGSLRDDRLFIVACDDSYAPKQYFNFFQLPRVQVYVVPTPINNNRCHAIDVLERLESIDFSGDDERWMLLDTDHYDKGTHLQEFTRIIKEATEKGIAVALSKPCFELWLLLHYVDEGLVETLIDASAVEFKLREILGEYNKRNLKVDHYPLESVVSAFQRAKALDAITTGGMIPLSNTSRVYKLWEVIIKNALPSQLPVEFQNLLF